jgi:Flp pilus assembly protein TadD
MNTATAHYNRGVALRDLGRLVEAETAFRRTIVLEPGHALALNNLGIVLQGMGRLAEAEVTLRQAIEAKPDHARAHVNLGNVLLDLGRVGEAIERLEHAGALDPANAKAAYNLGVALQYAGAMDRAATALRRAVALRPAYADAHYALARQGAADAEAIAQALDGGPGGKERSTLLFALANALERQGDVDGAFAALAEANALHRATLDFDVSAEEARLAGIAKTFDPALFARLRGSGDPSARPIFVLGMPRSGTTLVEQILSANHDVEGLGEIDMLGRIAGGMRHTDGALFPDWAADLSAEDCRSLGQAYLAGLPPTPGKARITDKAIANQHYVGLIHLILPNAPIVHVTRDPRDVGLSCFSTRFTSGLDYAYDLGEFARYWRASDALMAHWLTVLPQGRVLNIAYEDLVADLDGVVRRLIAHCGLTWDAASLDFHTSERTVKTASLAQVRRPIHPESVGRWRRFERHLQPLIAGLTG